jgi:hypothetical protein
LNGAVILNLEREEAFDLEEQLLQIHAGPYAMAAPAVNGDKQWLLAPYAPIQVSA